MIGMLFEKVEIQPGGRGTPLFAEVPVHAETAPYLVLSNKGFIWINSPFRGGFIRSAIVRNNWSEALPDLMLSVVKLVTDQGKKLSWGNHFPNTDDGRKAAEAYLAGYELAPTERLEHGPDHPWIPEGCALLVPKDRSYLGVLAYYDDSQYTVVVHNPARGLVVLGDWK